MPGKRPIKERTFQTYKAEHGTNIVWDLKRRRLVSPARKEEVFNSRHKFSSKTKGLTVLLYSIKGTGAKFLGFKQFSPRSLTKYSDAQLFKLLNKRGTRILVRSDNSNLNSVISMRERISQPRASFPNTPKGRREAIALMRDLNNYYGVVVHHIRRPQSESIGHGRVFIQGQTGTVWVYFAPRDPSTSTFARWPHKLVVKKSKKGTKEGDSLEGFRPEALDTCLKLASNIQNSPTTKKYQDIVTTSFVVYKGEETSPEFYDLLYIHGMKRPGFRSF